MADPDQRIKRVRGVAREPKIPKGTANSLAGRSEGFVKEAVCPRLDFRHLVGHGRDSIYCWILLFGSRYLGNRRRSNPYESPGALLDRGDRPRIYQVRRMLCE